MMDSYKIMFYFLGDLVHVEYPADFIYLRLSVFGLLEDLFDLI
jgi:hypothetical protein